MKNIFPQSASLQEIIEQYQHFQESNTHKSTRKLIGLTTNDYECRLDFYRKIGQRLRTLKTETLNEQDIIDYEILTFIIANKVAHIAMKNYLIPIDAEGGWYTWFASSIDNRNMNTVSDYYKLIADMKDFVSSSKSYVALLQRGTEEGRTLPFIIAKKHKVMLRTQIVDRVEESPFFKPFIHFPSVIGKADQSLLRAEGKRAALAVNDTYKMIATFFDDIYLPKTHKSIAISDQARGIEVYKQRIHHFTTSNITAEAVYEMGQKEVKRIKREMQSTLDEIDYKGTLSEFMAYLREDPKFYATTPLQLLKEASYLAKKIDGLLPQYFLKLPRNTYGISPVPAAIAPTYTSGRYSGGNLHEGRAGSFWVNTTKLNARPIYTLPSLTLHEAVPGHHLQNSLAQEMEQVPLFRRDLYISAFGEGWALYAELLGEEMGIYKTPYERFGRLVYEMWRACRLVVDPGMHVFGMTRKEAINFLSSHTALSMHECITEIDRYIGWPGQAVSYKMGELKIRDLRSYAEQTLGEKFNLRAFHDTILKNGSVPLFTLDRIVRHWVKQQLTK